jgi:pimeloyl-ACP methyl ester carboxylesterase
VSAAVATVEVGGFTALAAGPADAPLALVLHGFPDAPPTFAPLLGALADRGYRVVAPWLRGYAPSPLAGPYDVDRLADDVLAWADRLSPTQPVALVGHDWGAAVTYVACARAPARFHGRGDPGGATPGGVRAVVGATPAARAILVHAGVPGAGRRATGGGPRLRADRSAVGRLVPGLHLARRSSRRAPRHPAHELAGAAALLPRVDPAAGRGAGAAASSRSHRGTDPVPARRARRLHRPPRSASAPSASSPPGIAARSCPTSGTSWPPRRRWRSPPGSRPGWTRTGRHDADAGRGSAQVPDVVGRAVVVEGGRWRDPRQVRAPRRVSEHRLDVDRERRPRL